MTDAQFRVTVASDDTTPVVVASGDIDLANVADFSEAMAKAANGSTALTVDLTEVNYCDSAAVRALFAVAATTELAMLVPSTGPIKTLLGISGLDRVAAVVTME
jgi:anti-sigma B factor antagonist